MFSASTKSGRNSGATPDAQFNYVTMLLHGDGTNGAQNNTFLDSSTNAFSITRNGNTTQGSFSPYGSNWSNYFNGSSDYLSLGTSTNLALGAGDFTIEVFLSVTAYNASTSNIFEWRSAGGVPSNIPTLYLSASGVPIFYASVGSGALITGSSAVALNTWTHLAIVRSGSTVTMYLNGTSVGSATNSANLGTQSFYINDPQGTYRHNGYFSNVRMVKGTAVYTSSFTPSTTPFTAITNTQLLTCQSNQFIDNSSNAFAITVTGTPSVQRFNPFGTSTAYSTSVIGGSGYFDGSGDYLTASATNIANFGTGDFIVSAWFNSSTTTGNQKIFDNYNGNNNPNPTLLLNIDGAGKVSWYAGQTSVIASSSTFTPNTWNYVVVSRVSSTTKMFLNGTQVGSVSDTRTYAAGYTTVGIGGEPSSSGGSPFSGYITDLQVVKGSGVTSSTVPTAPVSASGSTLHLGMTNGAIFDNAMMNDLETVGNAQISTSVKKYGTGSLAFDGTGDSLLSTGTQNAVFGTGDFTVEMWIYPNTTSSIYQGVIDTRTSSGASTNGFLFYITPASSGTLFYYSAGTHILSYSPISTSTWTHIAVTRSSGSLRLFINGTISGSAVSNTTNLTQTGIIIGNTYDGYSLNGNIDDLRITKGYARYTANFTPPTTAFPNTGPT